MKKFVLASIGVAAAVAALVAVSAQAGPDKVDYPTAYQSRYVSLGDIDRYDNNTIRKLYINPESFQAAKSGQPLPDGTTLVLEFRATKKGPDGKALLDENGRFVPDTQIVGVSVQQKKKGVLGGEYPPELRNSDWDYAVFDIDGKRRNVDSKPCLACHKPREKEDFTFVAWRVIADQNKK